MNQPTRLLDESIFNSLFVLVYTPLGLLLVVCRFLCVILVSIMQRLFAEGENKRAVFSRLGAPVLGIRLQNRCSLPLTKSLVVCNCVSTLDCLFLTVAMNRRVVVVGRPLSVLENFLIELLCPGSSSDPVRVYLPETGPSLGLGVFDFHSLPDLEIDENETAIIGISVYRPLVPIRVSTHSSTFLHDLLFTAFTPFTTARVEVLDATEPTNPDYLRRAREAMCKHLGLRAIEGEAKNFAVATKTGGRPTHFEQLNFVGDENYRARKRQLFEHAKKANQVNMVAPGTSN